MNSKVKSKSEDKDKEERIKEQFGNKLKDLLKQANITQIQMANDLGYGKTSVNNWVKGYDQPQFLQLRKIILYLLEKIELNDFYPIQLLVPDFPTDKSSLTEIKISENKKNIQEQYKKKCQENEALKNEILKLKQSKNQSKIYYGKKLKDLDQEREKVDLTRRNLNSQINDIKKEKENYREKVRKEEIDKIDYGTINKNSWFPEKLIEKILKSKIISDLINKISLSENIIYEEILEEIEDNIISAIKTQWYYYSRDIELTD